MLKIFTLIFFLFPLYGLAEQSISEKIKKSDKKIEADFTAKEVLYSVDKQELTANGDVEVVFDKRILKTQSITYKKAENNVYVTTPLTLIDEFNNTYYANSAVVNDNLESGTITNIHAKLNEGGNVFANSAAKEDASKVSFYNASFTPCKICDKGRRIIPFWQFRSSKTKLNQENFTLQHYNARFNLLGVPVFYTPYIKHRTNLSERKTGLLIPKFGSSNNLGGYYTQPLYLNLAPNYDVTLTPTYYSKQSPHLLTEVRHLTEYGSYKVNFSGTNPKKDDQGVDRNFRGHVKAVGEFNFPERINAKFDIDRASDDTYLDLYGINSSTLLTSKVELEKFFDNVYLSSKAIFFQGLEANDKPGQTPYILPLINLDNEWGKNENGGSFYNKLSILSLNRTKGADYIRSSSKVGYTQPFNLSSGHLLNINASFRTDIYSLSDLPNANDQDTIHRVIPEVSVDWAYPLIKAFTSSVLEVKPIIKTLFSPFGTNKKAIPNEDSEVTEISDINVFADSYYTGIDVVDEGARVAYGFSTSYLHDTLGSYDFLLAQIYRPKENENLKLGSGLDENFSHIVGRFNIENDYMPSSSYRFRVDKDGVVRKNEVETTLNPLKSVSLNIIYSLVDEIKGFENTNQIISTLNYKVNDNWNIGLNNNNELGEKPKNISSGINLTYQNDCIVIKTAVDRVNFEDRDVRPETKFGFEVNLKTINF